MEQIKRGKVFYATLDPILGSEQGGERPVLIIQGDRNNLSSPTTIVAPITCQYKAGSVDTHVYLNHSALDWRSIALLEQIRTVDKQRLGRYVGSVSGRTMRAIEQAIHISLGLKQHEGGVRSWDVLSFCITNPNIL